MKISNSLINKGDQSKKTSRLPVRKPKRKRKALLNKARQDQNKKLKLFQATTTKLKGSKKYKRKSKRSTPKKEKECSKK